MKVDTAQQPKAEWFEEPAGKTVTEGLIYTAKEQVNLEFLDGEPLGLGVALCHIFSVNGVSEFLKLLLILNSET